MDGRTADAVMFPIGMFAHLGPAANRMYGIRGAFQGILNSPRLLTSVQPGLGACLVTRETDIFNRSLHFMAGHPLAGRERHSWFVIARGRDGNWVNVRSIGSYAEAAGDVVAGLLVKDPFAGEGDVLEQVQRDFDAKIELSRRPELRRAKLDAFLAAGHITSEEHDDEVRRQGLADVEPADGFRGPRGPAGSLGVPRRSAADPETRAPG